VTSASNRDYVAALDLGTTSSRCIVFDRTGSPVGFAQRDLRQILPQPGWVEHDPLELRARVEEIATGALTAAGISPSQLAAVGNNEPAGDDDRLGPGDRQARLQRHRLAGHENGGHLRRARARGRQDRLRAKTGLPLATYFSGPKIRWILDNVPGVRARAEAGEILCGTVDTWVHLEPDRRPARRTPRHGRDQRQPHPSVRPRDARMGRRASEPYASPAGDAPRRPLVERGVRNGRQLPARRADRGDLGDQQAALFGHAGFRAEMPRTLTGQAASRC